MTNKTKKAEIRQSIRQQRNQVSQKEALLAGTLVAEKLFASNLINPGQNISCFLSFDGEIPTQPILSNLEKIGAQCFLPKLRPHKPNRLWFLPYKASQPMTTNRYGIPEVDLPVNKALAVSRLDIVILPLVAFDLKGNRLGMGGGFYDETFRHLRDQKNRPRFIGLAYDRQKLELLPSDVWDLPLDGVCTESDFYQFTLRR